jgi:hypothetical protein
LGTALSIGDNPLPMGIALKISQAAVEGQIDAGFLEIQTRLEVPIRHLKLVIVISPFREFSKHRSNAVYDHEHGICPITLTSFLAYPLSFCLYPLRITLTSSSMPNGRGLKIALSGPGHIARMPAVLKVAIIADTRSEHGSLSSFRFQL